MLMTGTMIALQSIPSMVEATVEEANMADYSITLPRSIPKSLINQAVLSLSTELDDIQEYELRFIFRSTISVTGRSENTEMLLVGVEKRANLNTVTLVEGRYFEENEEAIIVEQDFGENLLGKNIRLQTPSGNFTLKIVGTCRAVWMPRSFVSSTVYALIPLEVLQRILKATDQVNQILVKVKNGFDPLESMNHLSDLFSPYMTVLKSIEGRVVPFAETQTYYNYLVRLFSLIGFSLLAAGLMLMYSSLRLMVTHETREIGTLKALGVTQRRILETYELRSLFLGLIGSSIGSLLGVIIAGYLLSGFAFVSVTIEGMIYVPLTIIELIQANGNLLILCGSLGVSLSLLLVLPSAWSASKVIPSQAMKSSPGVPLASSESKPRFKRGPLYIRYAFRNIIRKKGRELIVVLVIVIAVATNSTLLAASESQQIILNGVSNAINLDFFICLSRPVDTSLLVKPLATFQKNLTFAEFAYYTQAKAKGYTLFFIGAPTNSSYFNYSMIRGRFLENEEDGIVLTENLVKTLKADVGDVVAISNEITSINATVVGVRLDLVFNVPLVSMSTAQKLNNVTGKVNAIVFKTNEGVNIDRLVRDMRRRLPDYLWYVPKTGLIDLATEIYSDAFQSTAGVMIVFTWITSLFLIFSIAGQDINEERTTINILRALGMSKRSCISLVITKLLILGLFAACLGALITPTFLILFALFLSYTMAFTIPLTLTSGVLASLTLFILATIIPSGLALGIYATKGEIISALRYE